MAGKKFSIEAIFSALDKISAPIAKIKTKLGSLGKGAGAALEGRKYDRRQRDRGHGQIQRRDRRRGAVSVAGLGWR
jgi:hypothetical protein